MFKKIVFATDGSPVCEAAAKIAFELSEKYNSELILIYVYEDDSKESCLFVPDSLAIKRLRFRPDYIAAVLEGMKNTYGAVVKKNKDSKYEYHDNKKPDPDNIEYKVLEGEPAQAILDFALKIEADCIIMGAHGRVDDPDGKGFIKTAGKTLKKVIKEACCPVLSIARPCETCFWYFSRIVFGTNFSEASMAAFEFAYQLADYIGCKLHIFHALNLDSSGTQTVLGQKQIEDQIQEAKNRIDQEYVSQMHNFDNYDIAVWEGSPYIELLKFSREARSDLIVMGHHHMYSDPDEVSFGPTIEQVVLRSACPVISVNR
ncbi:universal stress protein [Desulfobacula phenolica]|uniref:Nucleotide-binding universal stress protein, UspA family n=1 Tax=Desulfobacula phenolica TaxID=90732 RepID=A0A1H2G9L4_9BACT|nr:universal stress protein [Desulfobacula phenolica]SDU16028.1 Nucleotide-binding universal stress protein, UspA family [Desulfobacula phenolica]